MNIVAIIQARMGSSRLPGKMMMDLCGYPVLHWVLHRVKRASSLQGILLATTILPQDDVLVELARGLRVKVFRGDAADVLGRFDGAAAQAQADVVVRVCADNPFIAPEEIDRLTEAYAAQLQARGDPTRLYLFNHITTRENRYPDGLGAEIFSRQLLRDLAARAVDPDHREHVTTYVWDHPEAFQMYALPPPPEIAYPGVKLDVDTQSDLDRLRILGAQVSLDSSALDTIRAYLAHFEQP
jgi:spore coat polysaccharide biosynthesis protein SpsF